MDCTQLKEQLGDYLDETELNELCKTIEEHMSRCPDCRVYVDSVKKTILLYQNDRPIEMPARVNQLLEKTLARAYGD